MPSESESESSSSGSESASPSPTAPDLAGSFYLSGIKVTDVPRECSGVNFVFSVFDQAGNPNPVKISSRDGVDIFTPTVYWYDNPVENVDGYVADESGNSTGIRKSANYFGLLSYDRTTYLPAKEQMTLSVFGRNRDKGAFTINFDGAGTHPSINDVGRIVVETQNDAIFKTLARPVLFPPLITPAS